MRKCEGSDMGLVIRRSMYQFSLRGLLGVMLLVGLGLLWWQDRQRLVGRLNALERQTFRQTDSGLSWSTQQVLGPPDTPGAGDIPTAWASQTPDGQPEWLMVSFARAVRPTSVVIHETYNPGAVCRVSVFSRDGEEVVAWTGKDPTPRTSARGVTTIPLKIDASIRRIKVYLDSPAVPGWNEIDAVGLRDASGATHWAAKAEASSCYGRNTKLSDPSQGILAWLWQ
jgi:hypothetical protein